LKTRDRVNCNEIQRAVLEVSQRHHMLRARFRRLPDEQWEQFILPFDSTVVGYKEHSIQSKEDAEYQAQQRQRSLDIQQGPVFAVDVFPQHEEGQVVLLSAHHLIIDFMSWRVIWHDLQQCLNGSLLTRPTLSFRTWCAIQQEEAKTLATDKVLPYSPEPPQLDYWGVSAQDNFTGHSKLLEKQLSVEDRDPGYTDRPLGSLISTDLS
jgi:hypothetical protein